MTNPIFLISKSGELIALNETPYDSEEDLQKLLADHPQLVYSVSESIPRLILVAREAGVPGDEGVVDSFSLDHLFLDQDGIPTLVEVKRKSDTRLRREVVGQMLDYAANANIYWTVDMVRGMFQSTWINMKKNPDLVLAEFIEDDNGMDEFWNRVKTNLRAGKMRLIFVADEIPTRVKTVVEFLNEQMDPCEVLALEIRQLTGKDGLQMIAPRIVGQTAKTVMKTGRREKRKWNEEDFIKELGIIAGSESVVTANKLLSWANSNNMLIWWGEGKTSGSFYPLIEFPQGTRQIFSVWTDGKIGLELKKLANYPTFGSDNAKIFVEKINLIKGVNLQEEAIQRFPSIPLKLLNNDESYDAFIKAVDWAYKKLINEY